MVLIEVVGAGGAVSIVLFLLWYVVRRVADAVQLCLRARADLQAERERRATMVAVAAVLPGGGAAVSRYEAGAPAWELTKPAPHTECSAPVSGEAA